MSYFSSSRRSTFLAITTVFVVAVLVYLPGLNGPFLLDDHANLNWLGAYGEINSWDRLREYFGSFGGGPLGRPIAKLTFLINSASWPANPFWFKFTNLLIHLANGYILYFICFELLKYSEIDSNDYWLISIFACSFWLLHPFLVSTVLYPVQRMAQLSAFFTMVGIWFYLVFRPNLPKMSPIGGILVGGVLGGVTILAVLSKENGVLLPMYLLLFEFIVARYGALKYKSVGGFWLFFFLIVPGVFPIAYLVYMGLDTPLHRVLAPRDFSLYERLLTELRVILDYLKNWFFPRLYTGGVFHDGYPISKSLFKPVSTFISLLFIIASVVLLFRYRKASPIFVFCALFFYAAHTLESTTLMLELYFEHRNYLPTILLFLPATIYLFKYLSRKLYLLVNILVLISLSGITLYKTSVWSSYDKIVEAGYIKSKYSVRAIQQYSMVKYNEGDVSAALNLSEEAMEKHPKSADTYIWHLILTCKLELLNDDLFGQIKQKLLGLEYDQRTLKMHEVLVSTVYEKQCGALSRLNSLYTKILTENPGYTSTTINYSQLSYLIGLIALYDGMVVDADLYFKRSIESRPYARKIMQFAALYATLGYYEYAIEYADIAIAVCCESREKRNGEFYRDIEAFKIQVLEDKKYRIEGGYE